MKVWEIMERLQEVDASLDLVIDADNVRIFDEVREYEIDRILQGYNKYNVEVIIIRI